MNQSLSEARRHSRESLFTDSLSRKVLIYGTEEQARKLYDTLLDIKALDGKSHELVRQGHAITPVDIQFSYSMSFTDDDVESGGNIAYVFQPRTKGKMDNVIGQFLHHLRIPDDVLHREVGSVIAINYTNMSYRFVKL